jgi:hypothetical protein
VITGAEAWPDRRKTTTEGRVWRCASGTTLGAMDDPKKHQIEIVVPVWKLVLLCLVIAAAYVTAQMAG